MKEVKVSAKSAHLPFHGCDPDYIRTTCHGRCCEGSSGLMVVVHPTEQVAIEQQGCTVARSCIIPSNPNQTGSKQLCPFKTSEHLCRLHDTPNKPFGCVASPFTLNKNNTLIVRNRYKLLRCYNDGPKLPAYKAFRASLDLIFGDLEATRICCHLDNGGGDIVALMPELSWIILRDNDKVKHHER
jgi:hypothetical protein